MQRAGWQTPVARPIVELGIAAFMMNQDRKGRLGIHAVNLVAWVIVTLFSCSALSAPAQQDFSLPHTKKPGTAHVILQAEDDGTPPLFAYRRVIIEAKP